MTDPSGDTLQVSPVPLLLTPSDIYRKIMWALLMINSNFFFLYLISLFDKLSWSLMNYVFFFLFSPRYESLPILHKCLAEFDIIRELLQFLAIFLMLILIR